MTPKTARIGSWTVLAILMVFLVLAIVFAVVGWGRPMSPPASRCPPRATSP
jgi:hypothetical protein